MFVKLFIFSKLTNLSDFVIFANANSLINLLILAKFSMINFKNFVVSNLDIFGGIVVLVEIVVFFF